jgi:hypothetical protein
MLAHARWATVPLFVALLAACGESPRFDALNTDATLGDAPPDTLPMFEAAVDVPPLGRVCQRNAQCDDGIDCTDDLCGNDNRCVNLPNAGRCDNGVYCDGAERCDTRRGCVRGEPVNCNDGLVCTADRCIEATQRCEHRPLDRDGDGDPDDHCQARECGDAGVPEPDAGVMTPCWRGHDCDDSNPSVSALSPEICGDGIDNNCNGAVDSAEPGGCQRAPHDRCDDPLDVSSGGVFTLEMGAARGDYALRCAGTVAHDMVARFHLDAPRDVAIEGSSRTSVVGLALQTACGGTAPEATLDCDNGFPGSIRRHSLPAGDYFVLVASSGTGPVDLTVTFTPPTPAPTNDTCATATVIPPEGGTFRSDLVGVADDVSTRCGGLARDVVYTFTLTEPRDVLLQLAGARTDYLHLSLTRDCARMPDVLRCDSGSTVQFTQHQLPAGTYFVVVESYEPVPFTLQATFAPPTPPAPGDTCDNPLTLTPGMPVRVTAGAIENDYRLSCYTSGRDAVFRFTLTERRDVQVSVRGRLGDYFAVAIGSDCFTRAGERTCITGQNARAFAIGLDPGTYYAVVKAARATDYEVSLETFAPLAITDVSGNDTCATAYAIPPGRGYFRGNTTPLANDYRSPCAGTTAGKDAVFSLTLTSRQRVTLVTDSSFFHVAWITTGATCPGTTPTGTGGATCTLGNRSTLDNVLDPGTYYIFVDGLSASYEGPYGLLVHLSAP